MPIGILGECQPGSLCLNESFMLLVPDCEAQGNREDSKITVINANAIPQSGKLRITQNKVILF